MDPPHTGFDELERAFEQADFLSLHQRLPQPESRTRPTSKHYSRHLSRTVPTTYADIPSDDSENDVSPISSDGSSAAFDVTITPPPQRHTLSRHNSGLPPTPPTMTNSDVAEPKEDRNISPVPLFADRVRNALESQNSGHSTPVLGNISPPTPNSSPPGTTDNLIAQRPSLKHAQSSYAESFKTATEGLGNSRSASRTTSQAQLTGTDGHVEEQAMKAEKSAPAPLLGLPTFRENWSNLGGEDSDRSEARVRVKNYQVESDSDVDRGVTHLASDDKDASPSEETPPSIGSRHILNHRAAFQRLRRPLQPGDELKRPDEALLYGSSRSWRPKKAELIRAPKRGMSAEFMRNAGLVKVNLDPEQKAVPVPEPPQEASARPTAPSSNQPVQESEEKKREKEKEKEAPPMEQPLREFAPSLAPAEVLSPPTTASKQSLEDNNQVYRLIQEENVKRHSGISDGGIQAMVVSRPEKHHTLRHTRKRESLRANVSVASAGHNSNEDRGAKPLRRKRASGSLNPHEVAARRVVSDQHDIRQSPSALQTTTLRSSSAAPDLGQESLTIEQLMGRHSAVEEDGKLAAERSGQKMRRQRGVSSVVANESRRISSAPAAKPRPWSMDLSAIPQSTPSPRLRKHTRGERLENNLSVRRTSMDHTAYTRDHGEERLAEIAQLGQMKEARARGDAVGNGTEHRLSVAFHPVDEESRAASMRSSIDGKPLSERRTARLSQTHLDLPTASKRKSLDPRYLHSNGTPFSTSQMSDRTAFTEPELCEARGVELYSHNNKSLLLIQQPAQPASNRSQADAVAGAQHPTFKAVVQPPEDPIERIGRSKHTVDSPLTNPRAAPEPPVIKFIPPTPSQEIEGLLGSSAAMPDNPRDNMQRRPSLKQRMRRFSEGLIEPLPFGRNGSVRRRRQQPVPQRPTYLSSNWVPNDIWAQYDDDEDDEEDDFEPLPPGGDTSDVGENDKEVFPRKLSKRMPGFRGKGGFLQGNSLGIDRHGTNIRRHHIDTRASQELLNRMTERSRRHRVFALPFSKGTKLEYIGFTGLGAKVREVRRRRQERALEKRRDNLRRQIGTRVFHEGRGR